MSVQIPERASAPCICIGRLDLEQMQGALDAVAKMLAKFGIDEIFNAK